MRFEIKENAIHMIFDVSESGDVRLLNFARGGSGQEMPEKQQSYAQAVEVHMAGDNQNDHHGAKHTCCVSREKLKYVSHRISENDFGRKLEVNLADERIYVTLNYQFYTGVSAVRCSTDIKNISAETVGIEYVSSFSLTGIGADDGHVYIPSNSWVRETAWKKYSLSDLGLERISPFSTKRIAVSNTGTWSSKEFLPMGCFEDKRHAYMWQIENNGSWNWEISDISDMLYLKLAGPDENENHWYKELKGGDTFMSVSAAVCIGSDFTSALEEMTKYRRHIVRGNSADRNLPVIFNDYMNCLWANPTEDKMKPIIDKAAAADAEYYCMDAGWYADGEWWDSVGEWQPCAKRFPHGIKAVFDYIKARGMVPGIWLEIESMGIKCPILDRLDDSCFFMRHGKRVIDHGRYQLDFRSNKVRFFADEVIDRVVREYGAGYIKMDYNIDAGAGTETDADSFGDGLLEHGRAYIDWISSVMDRYPELIIENCASGGMRMDYAMLAKHLIQSVSDREEFDLTAVISAGAATAVLPEQAAIWSYPKHDNSGDEVVFNMVNPLLMRMHLSGEIALLDEERFKLVKEGVHCCKRLRKYTRSLIPFYPLGLPEYNADWVCCGFKNEERIFVKVWKMNNSDTDILIPIKNAGGAKIIYSDGKCSVGAEDGILRMHFAEGKHAALAEVSTI